MYLAFTEVKGELEKTDCEGNLEARRQRGRCVRYIRDLLET